MIVASEVEAYAEEHTTPLPDLFDRLVCPIGGTTVKDKRPAVIAALAAAEVMAAALNFRQPVQVDISRRPAAAKLAR